MRHSPQGDGQVQLLDVGYVPCVRSNTFSLYAVTPKHSVKMNADGAHTLDGELSFVHRNVSLYVEATRVVASPIIAAVLTPRNTGTIGITDPHISLADSHADTLRQNARPIGIQI